MKCELDSPKKSGVPPELDRGPQQLDFMHFFNEVHKAD